MTSCERYDHATHYGLLSKWFRGRTQAADAGLPTAYPPTGFVVDGIAAGFLYLTNAPAVAFLDNFVSDPDVPRARRWEAMHELVGALCREADSHGIVSLWAHPSTHSLVKHGEAHGFSVYPGQHTAIVRNRCPL